MQSSPPSSEQQPLSSSSPSSTPLSSSSSLDKIYQLGTQTVNANAYELNLGEVDASWVKKSSKELQDMRIQNTKDLNKAFPGLVLRQTDHAGAIMASIRGIANDYYRDSTNPSIAIYVDGIPQDPSLFSQELLDVASIELIRGPQGTFIGQNAVGGVINIITNATSNKSSFYTSIQESILDRKVYLGVSTPLLENYLYVRGNFAYNHHKGMIKDNSHITSCSETNPTALKACQEGLLTSHKYNENLDISDNYLGNASVIFAPLGTGFSATFKYTADIYSGHGNNLGLSDEERANLKVTNPIFNKNAPYHAYYGVNDRKYPDIFWYITDSLNTQTYAFKLEQILKNIKIANVFSYQQSDYAELLPSRDPSIADILMDEFRFIADYKNGGYSVFGVFFQDTATTYNAASSKDKKRVTSVGIFSEHKIVFPFHFDLTLGARYSYDASTTQQIFRWTQGLPHDTPTKISTPNKDNHNFTPKIALGYTINDDFRIYASYQLANKRGGVNLYPSMKEDIVYQPEYYHSSEIGLHSSLLDGEVALNAAIYYIYISNKQDVEPIAFSSPPKDKVSNSGTASSKGMELNLIITPFEDFKLSFGGTYGQSRYLKNAKLKGNTPAFSPDFSFVANADYNFYHKNNLKIFANVNESFFSQIFFDPYNKKVQEGYGLLDASIRLEYKKDLIFTLYAQNILDQRYDNHNYWAHFLGDMRNIGLSLSYKL